jgi:hypothetical protein
MADSRRRFRVQLKRNVGFIRRSCELFDQGHKEEGIRIETALRVLLHDTQRSKSLLSHLKVKRIMKLNSSCHPPSPGVIMFEGMGRLTVEVWGHDVSRQLDPLLDENAFKHIRVPIEQWWEMPVYVPNLFVRDSSGQDEVVTDPPDVQGHYPSGGQQRRRDERGRETGTQLRASGRVRRSRVVYGPDHGR